MNQKLADFLRANINLIGSKDFTKLYQAMENFEDGGDVGSITTFFLSVGINPLLFVEAVPDYYAYDSGITNVVIPDNITSIGKYAFSGCDELTRVIIPNSVKNIDEAAFEGCDKLTSVTIGNGVERICDYAFYGCNGLTSIKIPGSVISIDYYAFEYCEGLTSVTIDDGVELIGDGAFGDCSKLNSITIPNTVGYIGHAAFGDCKGLTDIKYIGSKREWDIIDKYGEWDLNTGDYTVHCTDGDIHKGETL